jgi:hypothetical protein
MQVKKNFQMRRSFVLAWKMFSPGPNRKTELRLCTNPRDFETIASAAYLMTLNCFPLIQYSSMYSMAVLTAALRRSFSGSGSKYITYSNAHQWYTLLVNMQPSYGDGHQYL